MKESFDILAARQRIVSTLTEARMESGVSQQELANRIGTHKPNISRLRPEQGCFVQPHRKNGPTCQPLQSAAL